MREEGLEFVAQHNLIKSQEASKLMLLLHPTSHIGSQVTLQGVVVGCFERLYYILLQNVAFDKSESSISESGVN